VPTRRPSLLPLGIHLIFFVLELEMKPSLSPSALFTDQRNPWKNNDDNRNILRSKLSKITQLSWKKRHQDITMMIGREKSQYIQEKSGHEET
jgi:hypothetical protein